MRNAFHTLGESIFLDGKTKVTAEQRQNEKNRGFVLEEKRK